MAADAPPILSVQLVEEPRLLKLKKMFISKFKSTPQFYVRAPGRVNLIGEHIDYCGYSVLPMAIDQDILIAAEPLSSPVIHLANTSPLYSNQKYTSILCRASDYGSQTFEARNVRACFQLIGRKIPRKKKNVPKNREEIASLNDAATNCDVVRKGTMATLLPGLAKLQWTQKDIFQYTDNIAWKAINGGSCLLDGHRNNLNITYEELSGADISSKEEEENSNILMDVVWISCASLHKDHFSLENPSGINCLVEGTIPPSSGLSSSSALVCCAGLVTLMANGKTLSKAELADLCSKSERYIGTEGGGMDQSICFLAEKGTAKLLEFNPLKATDVKLPRGAIFVIANSCVEMNKAATSHFNIRVMECRLATKLLAQSRGLDWKAMAKLQDVQVKLKLSLEEMLAVVEEEFHPEPYSIEEIGENLGISPTELRTQILSQNTQDVTTFKLYQRAKHVYTEAARVLEFKKICKEAPDNAISLLGDLMNQSHASCKDLYECSCPELNQLVDICLQFGAVGSRLTGAGWGGCTVSMVPVDKLERFLANVKEAYYRNYGQRLALEENSLFATNPGRGAMIFLEA